MKTFVAAAAASALLAASALSASGQVLGQVTGTVNGTLHGTVGLPQVVLPTPHMPRIPVAPLTPKATAHNHTDAALFDGTLVSDSGSTAEIRFGDGSTQTFAIDAQTAGALRASIGHPVAFHLVRGTLHLAKDTKRGTLERLNGTTATVVGPAGRASHQYAVNAAAAAILSGDVGKSIVFTLDGNTMVVANNAPPSASGSATSAKRNHASASKSKASPRAAHGHPYGRPSPRP